MNRKREEQIGWQREGVGIGCYLGEGMGVAVRQPKVDFEQTGLRCRNLFNG